jgi:uncharacterized protein YndB with AHSA1/START domain
MAHDSNEAPQRLHIARTFRAAPEKLWEAWTNPALMLRWFGPIHAPAFECASDLRVGGKWSAALHEQSGVTLRVSGEYLAIQPPELLRFSFKWEGHNHEDGPGVDTIVEVRISAASEGAHMQFTHERLVSSESRDGHEGGWISAFDRLADFLGA